jgi:hypothetical protein
MKKLRKSRYKFQAARAYLECDAMLQDQDGPRHQELHVGSPRSKFARKEEHGGHGGFHKWGDPKMDGLEGKSY